MRLPRKTMSHAKSYQIFNTKRQEKIRLDLNENAWGCSPKVLNALKSLTIEDISLYPAYTPFLEKLAQFYHLQPDNVIISNGADDSIRCVFDCLVDEGDEILLPVPNYGMFDIYGRIRGAKMVDVLYNQDFSFPSKKILDLLSDQTKMIVIVNPANPLGTTIKEADLLEILKSANESFILLDETYFHFVDKSYVHLINSYQNLIITQTFSKAYGLTGLRLGMIFSHMDNIKNLAKVNLPFAVNTLVLKAASVALDDQIFIQDVVKHVQTESDFLQIELAKMGIETRSCKTNFLLMKIGDSADQLYQALQSRNILLRNLNKHTLLKGYLRISVGKRGDNLKFLKVLKQILSQEAILFDMDGVLVDVSNSYRLAVKKTAEFFLESEIDLDDIAAFKVKGGFNNDWDLTQEIIRSHGKTINRKKIIEKFQHYYLGNDFDGFIQNENWLLNREILKSLKKKHKLGIVTGRPRAEAEYVLRRFRVESFFDAIITMDETPGGKGKPDPFGVQLALEKLEAGYAIYLGDNVDDMKAASAANIIPIGVLNQDSNRHDQTKRLQQAGAQRILENVNGVADFLC